MRAHVCLCAVLYAWLQALQAWPNLHDAHWSVTLLCPRVCFCSPISIRRSCLRAQRNTCGLLLSLFIAHWSSIYNARKHLLVSGLIQYKSCLSLPRDVVFCLQYVCFCLSVSRISNRQISQKCGPAFWCTFVFMQFKLIFLDILLQDKSTRRGHIHVCLKGSTQHLVQNNFMRWYILQGAVWCGLR